MERNGDRKGPGLTLLCMMVRCELSSAASDRIRPCPMLKQICGLEFLPPAIVDAAISSPRSKPLDRLQSDTSYEVRRKVLTLRNSVGLDRPER
ncbi:hypothetical protein IMZ48_33530 [Candidatus Bathyarchaeota archaeon]|nr:hypothetical protein [Candidatus Bathyarchaeota archaeon]